MSDLIERSAVLHDLETLWDYATVDGITASTVLKQVKTDVKNIPAVDAVPVVRCKDCVLFFPDDDVWGWCTVSGKMRLKDYCSYGVKDGDDNGKT